MVIPYPFVGDDRDSIEDEYATLLNGGIKPKEISELLLDSLTVLLNERIKTKDPARYKKLTWQISDMLGRLLVFEEFLYKK